MQMQHRKRNDNLLFFTCTLNKNFKLCIPILILKRSKLYMVWTTWY